MNCTRRAGGAAFAAQDAFQVLGNHEWETSDMKDEEYMLAAVTEEDHWNDGWSEVHSRR